MVNGAGYRAAGVVPDGRAGTVTPEPPVIREARRRPRRSPNGPTCAPRLALVPKLLTWMLLSLMLVTLWIAAFRE